jgi:hypothetical protein
MSINIADTTPGTNDYIPVYECDSDVAENDSHGRNDLDGFSTDDESFSNEDDDDSACFFRKNLLPINDHCMNKN